MRNSPAKWRDPFPSISRRGLEGRERVLSPLPGLFHRALQPSAHALGYVLSALRAWGRGGRTLGPSDLSTDCFHGRSWRGPWRMKLSLRLLSLATSLVLLSAALWCANRAAFHWWAAGGPPTNHREAFQRRGNLWFVGSLAMFLSSVASTWASLRRNPNGGSRQLPATSGAKDSP